MKIFIIGGSGLVGARLSELLQEKYSIDNLNTSNGVDITRPETLDIIKKDSEHQLVLHLAAKTDVDGCEMDKEMGENGDAWRVNVMGTENVVNACLASNKKLIYISTDFVFNGENTPESGYKEESIPDPINWYAETKFKAEEIIRNSELVFIIARIAYPYRKEFVQKKDFVRAIKDRLANNQQVLAVTDHIMTPTFIDDIAVALDKLIETDQSGIFHVTGSQSLSPYDAAILIAEKFDLNKNLISKTTRAEYFEDKAVRPLNLALNNEKIKQLGVKMKTFREGLDAIK